MIAEATWLFRRALDAVEPSRLVAGAIRRDGNRAIVTIPHHSFQPILPLVVLGAGKAAARMAAGCVLALGDDGACGAVVTADGCGVTAGPIQVFEAGHPLPDRRGERAAVRIMELAASATSGVLCLLSGGASSLLVRPRPPVRLADVIRTTRALLACGADIKAVNTVRKHLSLVKGGGLLRCAGGPVVTLAISDVLGDDIGTIGSGPTVADPTTFAEAVAILREFGLAEDVPESVHDLLSRGAAGQLEETVEPGAAAAIGAGYRILANNRTAVDGAAEAARGRGWTVRVLEQPVAGDTTVAAADFAGVLRRVGSAVAAPTCVIAGGETTVAVRGRGRGGRNQEFSLALVETLAGTDWTVLSAGTDGIDGPTDAAGAFVDGSTRARAIARGLDPADALADNDSHGFFDKLGLVLKTGPTGTNVMDVKIALHPGGEARAASDGREGC